MSKYIVKDDKRFEMSYEEFEKNINYLVGKNDLLSSFSGVKKFISMVTLDKDFVTFVIDSNLSRKTALLNILSDYDEVDEIELMSLIYDLDFDKYKSSKSFSNELYNIVYDYLKKKYSYNEKIVKVLEERYEEEKNIFLSNNPERVEKYHKDRFVTVKKTIFNTLNDIKKYLIKYNADQDLISNYTRIMDEILSSDSCDKEYDKRRFELIDLLSNYLKNEMSKELRSEIKSGIKILREYKSIETKMIFDKYHKKEYFDFVFTKSDELLDGKKKLIQLKLYTEKVLELTKTSSSKQSSLFDLKDICIPISEFMGNDFYVDTLFANIVRTRMVNDIEFLEIGIEILRSYIIKYIDSYFGKKIDYNQSRKFSSIVSYYNKVCENGLQIDLDNIQNNKYDIIMMSFKYFDGETDELKTSLLKHLTNAYPNIPETVVLDRTRLFDKFNVKRLVLGEKLFSDYYGLELDNGIIIIEKFNVVDEVGKKNNATYIINSIDDIPYVINPNSKSKSTQMIKNNLVLGDKANHTSNWLNNVSDKIDGILEKRKTLELKNS